MKNKELKKRGAIYLNGDESLSELMRKLAEEGVTDFSKVTFQCDYIGCNADHGDGYCYCPSTYTDMRFEWEA